MENQKPQTHAMEPLLFEDLHRKVKEIQPMIFDGIRLALSRPLSPHLHLSHSMTMGMMNSSYKFSANYMGTKQVSPIESYPVLASEIQADGQMTANLIHLITPRLKGKVVASFARNQCTGSQASLDYKGDSFTSTLTAANIDLIKNSGILVGHLLHQFTKRVSIGPELVFQYGQHDKTMRTVSQLSIGGRYNADKYLVDATLSLGGVHVSYHQKANENLQFGAELMTDRSIGQSNAGFYYQYELTKAHTVFRGSLDTAWNVGAVLEKRFFPLPVVLSMSAVLNHPKNSTTVGLGLTVG
jgi:mitochondrial import receptor subunit TOM40